jgi:predicted ArsR family transcriptional regulator
LLIAPFACPLVKQRLLETVGRSARLKVLNALKRTPAGLPVGELAERLGMSYMGVKDLCVDLAKHGLLDTWRQAQKVGRPHLLYRLTGKAHELFPTASNPLTIELLEAAQKLYGAAAPEKLLLVTFHRAAERYEERLRGESLAERAEALARLRDVEGCMSELARAEEGALCIVEHHSPILDVLRAFPIVAKLEAEMFQRLLRVPVRREESSVSGLYRATFHLGNFREAGPERHPTC